jgi:hypothetical protein
MTATTTIGVSAIVELTAENYQTTYRLYESLMCLI